MYHRRMQQIRRSLHERRVHATQHEQRAHAEREQMRAQIHAAIR
jgi:hypothetical protein